MKCTFIRFCLRFLMQTFFRATLLQLACPSRFVFVSNQAMERSQCSQWSEKVNCFAASQRLRIVLELRSLPVELFIVPAGSLLFPTN